VWFLIDQENGVALYEAIRGIIVGLNYFVTLQMPHDVKN